MRRLRSIIESDEGRGAYAEDVGRRVTVAAG
jgi:hypothetical protein